MNILMYGLVTGFCFGFLLQKAQVLRYDRQIGALRLLDMTVVKFMLSTILAGMAGIYLLYELGLVNLSVKETMLGGNIIGGLIFGIGWGLLGYCPATQVGALAEGRWDALWGIIGMLVGAAIFVEVFPLLKITVLTWGNFGKITLAQLLGLDHWFIIPVIIIGGLMFFHWLEVRMF